MNQDDQKDPNMQVPPADTMVDPAVTPTPAPQPGEAPVEGEAPMAEPMGEGHPVTEGEGSVVGGDTPAPTVTVPTSDVDGVQSGMAEGMGEEEKPEGEELPQDEHPA